LVLRGVSAVDYGKERPLAHRYSTLARRSTTVRLPRQPDGVAACHPCSRTAAAGRRFAQRSCQTRLRGKYAPAWAGEAWRCKTVPIASTATGMPPA